MKPRLLHSLSALCLLAAVIAMVGNTSRQAAATDSQPAGTSRHRPASAPAATAVRHQLRTDETQLQQPDTAVFLASLNQASAETIDLALAARQVESFRLAAANEIPRLAEAIPGAALPLAKGLIAQALLRIPDPQVVQVVFNAACAETDPASREAVLLAFQSIELPAAHELLTTAIAASEDPQILSFIQAYIRNSPQPETAVILEELLADTTTPPACQEAIRDALAGTAGNQ